MYGFDLIKSEYIADIASEVFLYSHRSGARLVFVKNSDKNRVVMPVFKTLPSDDSGAAHVVEHCTLCGSHSFKLKDPFNALEKSTVYTYLNAITYEDKTVYPVASIFEDELYKMAAVYADALFKPLMLQNEGIFQQEGVYYDKNGANGVVLNEMKGVFSDESRLLCHSLRKALYGECAYKYYSGGEPSAVSKLTYNKFKDYYNANYTPDNCLVYIYGDVEIVRYMSLFDGYFTQTCRRYKPVNDKIRLDISNNFTHVNAGKTAKGLCGALFALCNAENNADRVCLSILCDILVSQQNSILRAALKRHGAINVRGCYDDTVRATNLYVYAEGVDEKVFKQIIEGELLKVAKNGIPQQKIAAAADKLRFYIQERDFGYKNEGIFWGLELLNGLLYGEESFEPLYFNALLDKAQTADYAELIHKYFWGRGVYGCTVKADRENKIEPQEPDNEPYRLFRAQKDEPSEIRKLTCKSMSGIKPQLYGFDYSFEDGCLFTEAKGDIVYLDLLYPLDGIDVSAAELYAYALRRADGGFADEIDRLFGSFGAGVVSYSKDGKILPMLKLSSAFMRKNLQPCLKLISSAAVIKNKSILATVGDENKAMLSGRFYSSGGMTCAVRAMAALRPQSAVNDLTSGIAMYNCLKNGLNADIAADLSKIKPFAVLYGTAEDRAAVCDNIELCSVKPRFINNPYGRQTAGGFILNSSVNSSAMAVAIPQYRGAMGLAATIAERAYIWDKIRTKGGAYSGGCAFLRDGAMYVYSERDPQITRTLELFRGMGEYFAALRLDENTFKAFVTGSAAQILRPVKPKNINALTLSSFVLDKTKDEELSHINDRFSCTLKDINTIGELIAARADTAVFVTMGGDSVKNVYPDCTYLV